MNLSKNKRDIERVELMPEYLGSFRQLSLSKSIMGLKYQLPLGISPIGLQGLIWPNSTEVLAKASVKHHIPFILSTVATASIEQIGSITNGKFWFQLYYPSDQQVRNDLLARAKSAGCQVLVVLADTPSFGTRYKDIRNGLAMPPSMSLRNVLQMMSKPNWVVNTLRSGIPNFATLKPYMPKNLNLSQLAQFMNNTFDGRLNEDKLRELRDAWDGKIVVKGIVNSQDAEKAIEIGADGIIVSNHGGRQIDAGESSIKSLKRLVEIYGDKIDIMMDGGVRSGPDIARCLASGAQFVFMGRPFMYAVGALGAKGGDHAITMYHKQLQQVMEQLGCEQVTELPKHLI